jgi:hypothetical protein
VFESLHSLSHPGIKASAKLVSQCFVCQPYNKTAALGPELVNTASAPKYLDTPSHLTAIFPSHLPASYISTSTSSALCRRRQDFTNASLQWTDLRAGGKFFQSPTSQLKPYHEPCWLDGFPVLVFLRHSLQTKDANSNHSFFTTWRSCVGPILPGRTLINPLPTDSSSGYTAPSKPPSCATHIISELRPCRFSCSEYEQPTRRT